MIGDSLDGEVVEMKTGEFMKTLDSLGTIDELMELLELLKELPDGPKWEALNDRIDEAFREAAHKRYPDIVVRDDAVVDIAEDLSGAFVAAYVWIPRH